MQFNLQTSTIYQAVKWGRSPIFRWAGALRNSFGLGFILFFVFFLFGFLFSDFSNEFLSFILGLALLSFSLFLFFFLASLFFETRLKHPKRRVLAEATPTQNLAEFLSFEVARAAEKTIATARKRKPPQVDSSLLFYFLLVDNPKAQFIFSRANLDFENIKNLLEQKVFPPGTLPFSFAFWQREEVAFTSDFEAALQEALLQAQKKRHESIQLGDALFVLAKHNLIFQDILMEADLKPQDIENLAWWLESLETEIVQSKRFWDSKNLAQRTPLARDWAAGYTITLDRYSIDWTEIVKRRGFERIIGHEQEISALERILARSGSHNNALLVGEPGSGRRSIIHALAQKILFGESLEELNYKRVVELDMLHLLSSAQNIDEVEEILDKIFQETVQTGNVILVIEEFHNYVGGVVKPGAIDISGMLSPYLQLPNFQIIATTSFGGLHTNIEQNVALIELFEKVEISELSFDETVLVLERKALELERKYQRFVTYPALREVVTGAGRYISGIPFPKKAIDLLDEVMVYVTRYTKSSFVLPEHVLKILAEKTQIPVGEVQKKEREILLNLESLIHKRIINQDEAVNEVSAALRRARAEITSRKGPMGTFLFLGPTGVGKTETSKALAEIYFGAESKMIRLDMSEFQQVEDIPRLLGTPGQEGLLTTPVRENPFSLVLLDEIEKAHPNILNLFLQVLDEGWVTDGLGRKIDFSNTIIIATSNAGYQVILQAIKEREEWLGVKQKLLDFLFAQGIFRPEFINRFDAVVVFTPLSKENLLDIAELQLQKIKKNLANKNIEFVITMPLKEKISELGYDPTFGARNMKRVIQDKVENIIARAILAEEIKKGDKIEVDPVNFSLQKL